MSDRSESRNSGFLIGSTPLRALRPRPLLDHLIWSFRMSSAKIWSPTYIYITNCCTPPNKTLTNLTWHNSPEPCPILDLPMLYLSLVKWV
ncbi:hypothetical protein ACN38_g4764 [Penicillium nordicum]|uniref:Uncharacterized protein n=1 Tax=Penicillium nordicum TaxID=229535 RepID=A0A0M8P671_9EURO|nr:hypothetical protein ACN38_g4764 [Penicillium nordicum]